MVQTLQENAAFQQHNGTSLVFIHCVVLETELFFSFSSSRLNMLMYWIERRKTAPSQELYNV